MSSKKDGSCCQDDEDCDVVSVDSSLKEDVFGRCIEEDVFGKRDLSVLGGRGGRATRAVRNRFVGCHLAVHVGARGQ